MARTIATPPLVAAKQRDIGHLTSPIATTGRSFLAPPGADTP